MFINYTNHTSEDWCEEQRKAAEEYGKIVDLEFPKISPYMGVEELYQKADQECERILQQIGTEKKGTAVLCQGECNLTYLMVQFLQKEHITVVSAVSERKATEKTENGVTKKESEFCFRGFRKYDIRNKRPEDNSRLKASKYDGDPMNEDKILIVPLGRGGYQNTAYVDETGEKIAETGYAFDAIVKKENPGRLMLIGTETSNWEGVIDWYCLNRSESEKEEAEALKQRLKKVLKQENQDAVEQYIRKAGGFVDVKIALIPEGKNEEEIQEYFEKMRDGFDRVIKGTKEPKVIFDISNGFRSIPLYMMMLIRYVGMIGKKKLTYTVYYGMFDARNQDDNTTPLVNLTMVSELTEWINAISEFRSFGSVKKLYQCLKEEKNQTEAAKLIERFELFDYALNSNNLYYLEEEIRYILDDMNPENMDLSHPAKMMLQNLKEDFTRRFEISGDYKYGKLLVELAKLYTEQGRYGAAAVAVQEGVITYSMERYVREEIVNVYGFDHEQYTDYMRNYQNRNQVKAHFDEKVILLMKKKKEDAEKNNRKEQREFIELYWTIKGNIRNVEAHFIWDDSAYTVETMKSWLNRFINLILEDMRTADADRTALQLAELYNDFRVISPRDAALKFLTSPEKGKEGVWNLLNTGKPENKKENKRFLKEAGISLEKIAQLREELLRIKSGSKAEKIFTEKDLEENPLVRKVLVKWVENIEKAGQNKQNEQNKQKEPDNASLLKCLNGNGKNPKKNFLRLENTMKANIKEDVFEILKA